MVFGASCDLRVPKCGALEPEAALGLSDQSLLLCCSHLGLPRVRGPGLTRGASTQQAAESKNDIPCGKTCLSLYLCVLGQVTSSLDLDFYILKIGPPF